MGTITYNEVSEVGRSAVTDCSSYYRWLNEIREKEAGWLCNKMMMKNEESHILLLL